VLCLAGGGLRAAFQMPIVEALVTAERYDMIMGISAGAVNGVYAAQDDLRELRLSWTASNAHAQISSVPGAFAISHRPWESVYSLAPLRHRLAHSVSLSRLRVPFACGVVVRETREYRMLASTGMVDDGQLCTAIVGSSSIAGLMPPVAFHCDDGPAELYDGGHRHCVPPIPDDALPDVTHVDAVVCLPLSHRDTRGGHSLAHAMLWAFENQTEIALQLDLDYLKVLRQERDIRVRVYAPQHALGGMFDGRRATIEARVEQGEAALDHPLEL
jgi:predicted acylesterase/phospholipase RssA